MQGEKAKTADYIFSDRDIKKELDWWCRPSPRVKRKMGIEKPYTVCLDLPFSCPGRLQGMILAGTLIKAGEARRVLFIGAEILSRMSDPHDVDSMI